MKYMASALLIIASAFVFIMHAGARVHAAVPTAPSTTLLYLPFIAQNSLVLLNKIAVACYSGSASNISTVSPDGTGLLQLTNQTSAYNTQPAWSPDGTRIAFRSSTSGGTSPIYIMNADGSGIRELCSLAGGYGSPTWSPDGSRIAFSSNLTNPALANRDIYVMNADGSGTPLNLTNSATVSETAPDWSPDGTKIAYVSSTTTTSQIYVMNADGSGQTSLSVSGYDPNWSPDSQKITYGAGGAIFVMNANGTSQTQLTTSNFYGNPNWSPSGQAIAFSVAQTPQSVLTVNADGTGQVTILSGCSDPDWR